MSILESIKGERRLSMNHWRYRLLHWCFNVKAPKNISDPLDCELPKFLYTHYCPLFHLTNLIAILSPLVLLIKVIVVLCKATAACFKAIPWHKIKAAFASLKVEKREEVEKPAPKKTAAQERREVIECICTWRKANSHKTDFKSFWAWCCSHFKVLSQCEVEVIYSEYLPKIIEAEERAAARKKRLREALIFWSNFSRVFIKWALNIFYVLLSVLAIYGVYLAAGPVWDALCWLGEAIVWLFSSDGFTSVLWGMAKVVFWSGVFFGLGYGFFRSGMAGKFAEVAGKGLKKCAPPFYLVGSFFAWIGRCWRATMEFIEVFYEENCPMITIVTPEEEKIEQIATGEDQ